MRPCLLHFQGKVANGVGRPLDPLVEESSDKQANTDSNQGKGVEIW